MFELYIRLCLFPSLVIFLLIFQRNIYFYYKSKSFLKRCLDYILVQGKRRMLLTILSLFLKWIFCCRERGAGTLYLTSRNCRQQQCSWGHPQINNITIYGQTGSSSYQVEFSIVLANTGPCPPARHHILGSNPYQGEVRSGINLWPLGTRSFKSLTPEWTPRGKMPNGLMEIHSDIIFFCGFTVFTFATSPIRTVEDTAGSAQPEVHRQNTPPEVHPAMWARSQPNVANAESAALSENIVRKGEAVIALIVETNFIVDKNRTKSSF